MGDFELIVVDDASTDDTVDVVEAFADPRIRLVRHDSNRGGAAARDAGIATASSPYVALLDSDDEWLPPFLERVVAGFESSDRVGVVETGWFEPDGTVVLPSSDDVYRRLLTYERNICLSAIAFRRDAVTPDIRFDNATRLAQDRHVFMELSRHHDFLSIGEPLARIHRDAGEHLNVPENQLAKRLHFFDLHADELRARPQALARHHAALGSIHLRMGAPEAARREYRRALAAGSGDLKSTLWWAVMWSALRVLGGRARILPELAKRIRKRE